MDTQTNTQAMPAGAPEKKGMGKVIFAVVIILIILGAGLWYWMTRPEEGSPEAVAREVRNVVAEVSRVMVLPSGEEPTVGTITDTTVFAGQAFFEGAQEGDKILVYPNKGMVILYSAAKGKILGVAPLSLGAVAGASASVPEPVVEEEIPTDAASEE